jgi:HEAT repeat protein
MTLNKEDVRSGLMPDEPAYEKLARRFGKKALVFLEELAGSPDSLLAGKAVSLAGFIGGAEAVRILRLGAAHKDTGVRAAAAYSLQRFTLKDAGPLLQELLDDPDPPVLKFAIRTAAKFPGSAAIRKKLTSLKKSSKEHVRLEAEKALSG